MTSFANAGGSIYLGLGKANTFYSILPVANP